MKCNKCLKQIPKGEEIKMYCNGGEYSRKGSYGGCYCEGCWKTKREYRIFEDGSKTERDKDSKIPSWGWFFIGVITTIAVFGFLYLLFKEKE